jgi:hypothetical protein
MKYTSQYGSREDRKKLALIREFTGNMGVLVTPDLNTAGGDSVDDNMRGTDKLTIQNHKGGHGAVVLNELKTMSLL